MAVINTTGTFTNNEQVTSTKLNNIADQSSFVQGSGGAAADSTLFVTTGGQLKVGTITATEMGTNSVEAAAIKNGEVTVAKLSTGAPTWTSGGNVTVLGSTTALSSVTATTASVSIGSARTASGASNIDFNSTFPLTSYEARISRESGADGNLVISNTGNGTIKFNNVPLGTQSGTAPIYGARAWVNFNGTTSSDAAGTYFTGTSPSSSSTTLTVTSTDHGFIVGHRVCLDFTSGSATDGSYLVATVPNANTFTVTLATAANTSGNVSIKKKTIRQKGNVHSVVPLTTSTTGDYYINFLIALPDADYAIAGFSNYSSGSSAGLVSGGLTISQTATTAQISTSNSTSGTSADYTQTSVTFFR
jgi:hypothetical protein